MGKQSARGSGSTSFCENRNKKEANMENKVDRVKSKNLFNFPPQGHYDEDLKG